MHTAKLPATIFPVRVVSCASESARTATGPCSTCHLKDICLPCGLPAADTERLDRLFFARRAIKEGETLYHEGEKFGFLYAVRSGTFKVSISARDGREQVSGFQMAGEFLGLDGLASGQHASSAVALEDAQICAIPFAGLKELAVDHPEMQQAISRLMGREIVREHGVMALLAGMSAEERLASFLLNVSSRMKARGYSPSEFHLRMTRAEIGSYLGMKLETVSRAFSAFQQRGFLTVDKKHVLLEVDALQRAFDGCVQ